MNKELEVISVLGPLGAGKTTTLNHLIEQVPLGESYAVVVNDVGETNIDARRIWDHPANRSDKIIPLTAGCIGCSDVTQFREALERVHDSGVNILFIEPTGIAPGTEIADVVRSSGFDLSVLTLANAKTIERDMRWQVLPSQLSVADIVGITHIGNAHDEAEVMAQVLEQLPPLADDVLVELIKPGSTNYFEVLAKLRGVDKPLYLGRQALAITQPELRLPLLQRPDHHHDHTHDHEHDNSHGIAAKSFKLRPDTSLETIRSLLMPYTSTAEPLLRAKGTTQGIRFDIVGDEWNIEEDTNGKASMNVIFAGHIPPTFLAAAQAISESVDRIVITEDKKTIVKSSSELPVADRVEIALERASQYPHPISPSHGELIPDCEADQGYELSFWGHRDDMPDEIKRTTMKAYLRFRLDGLHELLHHTEHISNADTNSAYWFRRYGATLGYNGYYLQEYIDTKTLQEIRAHNPAQMLFEGFMRLEALTFDEGRAEEKPEFVANVMKAAVKNNDIDTQQVETLKQHALSLSEKNSIAQKRWNAAFETFDTL